MHQSIPAVPIPPPRATAGAFAHVVSPGGGAFAILSAAPGAGHWHTPGRPPAFDTRVFERQISLSGRTRLACPSGTRKTFRCFKGMFSQF